MGDTCINKISFGEVISRARKDTGWSQKELARRIWREDNETISQQYLNDIEHDRRNPSSDHIIGQFSVALDIPPDYLHYLAGRLPPDIREQNLSQEHVERAFASLRSLLKQKEGENERMD